MQRIRGLRVTRWAAAGGASSAWKRAAYCTLRMEIARLAEGASDQKNAFLGDKRRVSVVSANVNAGQSKAGVEQGPEAIIAQNHFAERIEDAGWEVNLTGKLDYTVVPDDQATPYGMLRPRTCGAANKALHERALSINKDDFSLILGGDHSVAIGSISAMLKRRPDTVVVWVDAHADLNTDKVSPSGNIHGMPVAMLMGLMDLDGCPGFEWLKDVPQLKPSQIVYVGLRDVDPGEKELMVEHGIKAYSMHDIDRYNIGPIMDRVMNDVDPYGTKPIHLSFDIDSIDPAVAPSTGTPVIGGLTFREAAYICEVLSATNRLCSMDLVEVNPALRSPQEGSVTADVAKRLTSCALGETLLWGGQPHKRKWPLHEM